MHAILEEFSEIVYSIISVHQQDDGQPAIVALDRDIDRFIGIESIGEKQVRAFDSFGPLPKGFGKVVNHLSFIEWELRDFRRLFVRHFKA